MCQNCRQASASKLHLHTTRIWMTTSTFIINVFRCNWFWWWIIWAETRRRIVIK